jgi:hypothetical protein
MCNKFIQIKIIVENWKKTKKNLNWKKHLWVSRKIKINSLLWWKCDFLVQKVTTKKNPTLISRWPSIYKASTLVFREKNLNYSIGCCQMQFSLRYVSNLKVTKLFDWENFMKQNTQHKFGWSMKQWNLRTFVLQTIDSVIILSSCCESRCRTLYHTNMWLANCCSIE